MISVRHIFAALLCSLLSIPVYAQLLSTGGESTITYTPPNATIATNTPAINFTLTSGTNTFLMNVNPTVAAKVYVTNQTANACLGAFSLSMFAASGQAASFNNTLQSWQSIPIINATGQLVSNLSVDIPASSTIYVTSTSISSPRIAIQLVNVTGLCSSTNIDVNVVFTPVSITSPLVTNTNGTFGGGILADVQGVTPAGTNGATVLPIVDGAVQPAINAGFTQFGIDTFSGFQTTQPVSSSGNFVVGIPPSPSTSIDWGLVFYTGFSGIAGTGLLPPWTCINACGSGIANLAIAQLSNVTTSNKVITNLINTPASSTTGITNFVLFNKTPIVRQQNSVNNISPGTSGPTVSGSTLVAAFDCNTVPCVIDSVSDTQGNLWKKIVETQSSTGLTNYGGQSIWVAGPSLAAAETATGVAHSGTTVAGSAILELTGTTPAIPNTPVVAQTFSNNKFRASENDNGGVFQQSGGFSYVQTTTLSGAATTLFPLWDVTQHGVFSSCVVQMRVTAASGTTPTLNTFLQDSTDQLGWDDRLSLTQATAATNLIGSVPVFSASNLSPTANSAVVATDGVLAAGSGVAGPMGPFGRIKFVVAGTTPSFTINYSVVCK